MKRKDIFFKTKRSVTLISAGIVFFCLLIFAIITTTLYTSRVFVNVDNSLLQEKEKVQKVLLPNPQDRQFFEIGKNVLPPTPPNIISILYKGDRVLSMNPNPYFDEDNLPDLGEESKSKVEQITFKGYKFRGVTISSRDIRVQLLINIDSEVQSINQLIKTIIMALVILIGIALVLSYILSSKVIKPIKKAYDKQVFFVQDASHEMKTPLAVIKGKLELLANSWDDKIEDHFEHISKMMSEVRDLEKLNSDLLLLSKEDIDNSVNIVSFELEEFIEDLSEFYVDLAEVQEKNFIVNRPLTPVIVKWDYSKVKRMLIILLENAFKYTEEGGKISLSFEEVNKNIKIIVLDNGIGIKEEDIGRIFDRFFRSADVRGKNIKGSGIGLSLLKSIGKTLGTDIKLYSKYGIGTRFEITIPKILN
ncbi:sensor histidine kinase [Clostridium perfringens]|uniref:sensor histidine kinase n=1 Tax=Clostridium perfringens TaxID=1502 RepID=UPI00374E9538